MKIFLSLRLMLAIGLVGIATDAQSEVIDSSDAGFTVRIETTIDAPPTEVYDKLIDVERWWHPDHTYSGKASNLYIAAEEKGWFGERLPNGGVVQHMEVIHAAPGKLLRLRGCLGPLQEFALVGTMTWSLEADAQKTNLRLIYYVGGYRPGGVSEFAKPVDSVLDMQADRLKCYCQTGSPTEAR